MNIIQGFATNSSLVNNTPGQTAQFGEISVFSQTFSKEIGQYKDDGVSNDITLLSFYNLDDIGNVLSIPSNVQTHILSVASYIYTRFLAANIPNNLTTVYAQLVSQFTNTAGWNANALIPATLNNAMLMPDYLSWTFTDVSTSEQYALTIWFGDQYFRAQYANSQIVIVPPFSPVDGFYDTNANVGTKLAAVTTASNVSAIMTAMANNPCSIVVTEDYTWEEPVVYDSGSGSRTTTWTALVYGPNGNNPTAIKQAIRDYLANPLNSSLTTLQWSAMFPTIYDTAEYYIVPLWQNVMGTIPSTVYSPVNKPASLQAIAIANVDFTANSGWWTSYLSEVPTTYQQLSVLIIGAPTNTSNNDYDFALKFPDYLDISLTDPDAGRMLSSTQGFIAFMLTLLAGAETLTETTPIDQIPAGYTRVVRSAKVFLEGTYNGITYLALAKVSYVA